jgi:hypothetical protein
LARGSHGDYRNGLGAQRPEDHCDRDPGPFADRDEAAFVCRAQHGFGEEVGVEIGEVETMLSEVRQSLGFVPDDPYEFLYTEIDRPSTICVYGK